ncbi:plastid division protein CDP1, chloroplastic isoform X2 [Andrographis paniculata]|uniref:plastid division protein CDP1, chloroplastic isoform X2 n=1 Tax=Andrographis paniculata TaxID=175694 RepID=UPI0021E96AA5|nr:plastid division protein CDP1, chloroplastic isoform X2 [Andrographis paniculata]
MANIHALVPSVNNATLCSTDSTDSLVSAIDHPWRLCAATELNLVQESSRRNFHAQSEVPFIEIPVTCYQIIGVHDQAEKDEIVKSVKHLKNVEIEEGYTKDTVISRQDLLMDVRDKLLFEPEYAGNLKDNQTPKSSLKIPWTLLPGALCLLQEVGEEKLVLDIGRRALQHPESKPFVHDLLLSMAHAECAIAKNSFEKNNTSQGFEALARARCLLRSKISLGKMTLLSQIEESLEDLAPACTLDLLGMPHTPENAERRLGAVAALRELLRQGLDVETSCQVKDWPCFLNQALKKLMATEIVELLPWDNLAVIRKNRKSLESQSQRIVIDFNSFYVVFLAHIALGFSSRQTDLIKKANSICECLTAAEGIDLKFEEAFCYFLLGQGDEATAVEKLRQLELSSGSSSQKSLQMKETREVSSSNNQLETWLKEAVLGLFPDTRDCSASLADFFIGEKKASGTRDNKRAPPASFSIRHRPLSVSLPIDRRLGEPVLSTESSRQLGPAAQQLTPPNLQSPLTEGKSFAESNVGSSSVQLKRTLGSKDVKAWKFSLAFSDVVGKITYAAALGCILGALFKLINMQVWKPGSSSRWMVNEQKIKSSSSAWTDLSMDLSCKHGTVKRNGVTRKLKKVLSLLNVQSGDHLDSADLGTASVSSGLSSSMTSTSRQSMPVEDAEGLVKRWQAIKAEALGPAHDILGLSEILEGSMLVQWEALAEAAKTRSCFWKFVLLQLKIVSADILSDGLGKEMAEIEVLLEEAAELVGESQLKNPTYYSTYRIHYLLKRQEDGSWRFCEADILTPT